MKRIILLICTISLSYVSVLSQSVKPHFRSINAAGIAVGESHPQMLFQSVNGLIYKDWFAGVGVGLDEYEIKSLPLFADIRMNFGDKKKGFIYGDIGYNFFLEDKSKEHVFAGSESSYKGGIYTDFGIGMRTSFIKKVKMVFTLGHSYKTNKETQVYSICGIVPPCFENVNRYIYYYGRLNLKVGVEL